MLKFAFRNLLSRPMRSLLSLLGLTVAIIGMVGLFSVARGLDKMISETFNAIPGLIAMQPGAPVPLFSRLPTAWGDEIADVSGVSTVNSEVWQRVNIIDDKLVVSPPRFLFGTDITSRRTLKRAVYRDNIIPGRGRFLSEADRGTLNVVVSRQIAEEFNKGVGNILQVNGNDMPIVGIYHTGFLLLDVAIICDLERLREIARFDADSVCAFYIEADDGVDNNTLADRIRTVFRGRDVQPRQTSLLPGLGLGGSGHPIIQLLRQLDGWLKSLSPPKPDAETPQNSLSPTGESSGEEPYLPTNLDAAATQQELPTELEAGTSSAPTQQRASAESVDKPSPIEIRSAADWAERFEDFAGDLDILLGVLTGIGVTVAVLSIVNTMLMSVTERIIEFGILKANGWSKTDVMKLITFESAIIGFAGGVLGSLLGRFVAEAINWYFPTRASLYASPGLLLFGVGFSTALGILGGLYPAVWAMRMMPMDAIRRG